MSIGGPHEVLPSHGILSGCSSTAMIVDTSGQAATATPFRPQARRAALLSCTTTTGMAASHAPRRAGTASPP